MSDEILSSEEAEELVRGFQDGFWRGWVASLKPSHAASERIKPRRTEY